MRRVKLTHILSYISILLHVEVRPILNLTITCHFDSNFSIATCTCTSNILFIAKNNSLTGNKTLFFIVSALQLSFLWSVKNLKYKSFIYFFIYLLLYVVLEFWLLVSYDVPVYNQQYKGCMYYLTCIYRLNEKYHMYVHVLFFYLYITEFIFTMYMHDIYNLVQ